ncbi:ATP-grasp domain-containing protein [Allorhodopirellula solitaria]|uniref:ATP-grasp domain-containing protein n=1 Tax=Allorhodopirellula solitaria TaxID=2527987 RepID=UPI00164843DD|nr:ATP-grasp domain-containing protein [Allorhodopirellula solitaria]
MQSKTVTNPTGPAKQVAPQRGRNAAQGSVLLVGSSVRWAAQSAAACGFRVVGMDCFGDLDTRAACTHFQKITSAERADRQQLVQSISQLAARQRAAVIEVGGLMSVSPGLDEPFQRHPATALSPAQTELAEQARDAGFRVPESVSANLAAHDSNGRWLVKESQATGGLGVSFRESWHHREIPASAVLQRWIPGRAMGLVALADEWGVSLLGMTQAIYQRIGDRPFIYAGSRTTAPKDAVPWSAMHSLCEQISRTRRLRGLFNLDWIVDRENQWWLLEINERPSASCEVLEKSMQHTHRCLDTTSLMRGHLAAVLPQRFPIPSRSHAFPSTPLSPTSSHVKRIVYSRSSGQAYLTELARQKSGSGGLVRDGDVPVQWQIADVPADGTPVQRGQPIATLLVDGVADAASLARCVRLGQREIQKCVRS